MAAVLTWYKNNSMKVTLTTLQDSAGTAVTNATLTGTLATLSGTAIWTGTLTHSASGTYSATVTAADAAVTAGQRLTLTYSATINSVANAFTKVEPVVVEERGGDD